MHFLIHHSLLDLGKEKCVHVIMTCSTHFQADHMISYLPLSHIAAQMMDIHAQLSTGLTIHFAQPDALKGSLKDTLKACDSI